MSDTPIMDSPIGQPDTKLDLLAEIIDDCTRRCRNGERPTVEEYADLHPGIAAEIRELLPAILAIEQSGLGAAFGIARTDERVGMSVGRYKLLEQIGEGGFGVVFLAEQQHPVRRKVAVKLMKPGMDTRQVIARFEAERQALAVMEHENIARVLDAGTTDSGRPYFVMELVRGVPITSYCDCEKLAPAQRLQLFLLVCRAVQHAHIKGIIHRDLKPTNILVTLHDGVPVPKVIDFGVAKATGQTLTDKTLFTHFAQLVGTPLYMSPEQAEMSGLDVDTRSDVYSLGVLLYELLTGTTPVQKEQLREVALEKVRQIIREQDPPRPSTRVSSLGEAGGEIAAMRRCDPRKLSQLLRGELDWIVMRAMEKDRQRRYESAADLAADVQRYLDDAPVLACPPSAAYRMRKFVRRYRLGVLVGGALLSGVLLAVLVLAISNVRISHETRQKEHALAAAQASEQQANERLFLSLLSQGQARRFSRSMGQRLDSLDALAKAALIRPDDRLRDEATAAMALPDVRMGTHFSALGRAAAVDDRFDILAQIVNDTQIDLSVLSSDSGDAMYKPLRRINTGAHTFWLSLSHDGKYVVQLDDHHTLRLWGVADGEVLQSFDHVSTYQFAPDNKRLFIAQRQQLRAIDIRTGQEMSSWTLAQEPYSLTFDAAGRQLAVGYSVADVISIYDAGNGRPLSDLKIGLMSEAVSAWHPDGEHLAISGSDPRIQVWDVPKHRRLGWLEGHVQNVTSLSFHPEGEYLSSHSWDGVLRIWQWASGRQVLALPLAVEPAIFSSNGRWAGVAWSSGGGQMLEFVTNPEYRTLVGSDGIGKNAPRPAFSDISADGRLLAVNTPASVLVFDLEKGRQILSLPGVPFRARFGTDPGQAALLVSDVQGVVSWPIQRYAQHANVLHLGPRKLLWSGRRPAFCLMPGGKAMIVSDGSGPIWKIDLHENQPPVRLGNQANVDRIAISGDGHYAATSGWHSDQVRLWDLHSMKMIHEWVNEEQSDVFFMPNNQTLIISRSKEFGFYDVQTHALQRRMDVDVPLYSNQIGFSPDGLLMAMQTAPGVLSLFDAGTLRKIAVLQDPYGDRTCTPRFTPDGTQLTTTAIYAGVIHIWDLSTIRQHLKSMHLDWNWPDLPARQNTDGLPISIDLSRPADAARPPG